MAITPEQYEAALKVVAEKELGFLEEMVDIFSSLKESLEAHYTQLDEIRQELPNVSGAPSQIKGTLEQYTGQVRSFSDQINHMHQTSQNMVHQINPPVMPTLLP